MKADTPKFETVEQYFSALPPDTGRMLKELRKTIQQAAPDAVELISYNMPAFKQRRVLVYYAAYKGHIGFYPTPSPLTIFKKELADYETSKGAVRFPLDKPLPLKLIAGIVKFRIKEDMAKARPKTKTAKAGKKKPAGTAAGRKR